MKLMRVRGLFPAAAMAAIAAMIVVGLLAGCNGDPAPPPAAQTQPPVQQVETAPAVSDNPTPDEQALVAAGEAEPDPPIPPET